MVASAPEREQTIASSAVPTMQRIGYAAGSAAIGIVANAAGFSDGLSPGSARAVATVLFLAPIPLALLGVAAAVRASRAAPRKSA